MSSARSDVLVELSAILASPWYDLGASSGRDILFINHTISLYSISITADKIHITTFFVSPPLRPYISARLAQSLLILGIIRALSTCLCLEFWRCWNIRITSGEMSSALSVLWIVNFVFLVDLLGLHTITYDAFSSIWFDWITNLGLPIINNLSPVNNIQINLQMAKSWFLIYPPLNSFRESFQGFNSLYQNPDHNISHKIKIRTSFYYSWLLQRFLSFHVEVHIQSADQSKEHFLTIFIQV